MGSEYRQSLEELQQHLKDTVQALELSGRAFDKRFEGEAKRLATVQTRDSCRASPPSR